MSIHIMNELAVSFTLDIFQKKKNSHNKWSIQCKSENIEAEKLIAKIE